ncbi:MAG: hypothetical protein JJU36_17860 [Phycisphaeraceae bacterium]|nr:hypothetical protein [Phycisphaeraceae bacterium]
MASPGSPRSSGAHRNNVGGWVNWYRREVEAGLEIQRIGRPVGSGRKLTRPQEIEPEVAPISSTT